MAVSMLLDIRTVTFTAGAVIFALSIFCALVLWTQKTYDGFKRWTVSNVFLAGGLWLLSLRDILPDFLTIVLSNIFVISAQVLILQGVYEFRGLRLPRPVRNALSIASTVSLILLGYFTYWEKDVNARIVFLSTYAGVLSFSVGRALLRNIPQGQVRGSYLIGSIAALSGIVHFARVAATILHPLHRGIFSLSVVNSVFFLLVIFAAIGWTLGFILLNQERLIQDLKDAECRAALANNQLQVAIEHANASAREAARANQAKTDSLANIGHEIRTPLNGILGMTQLLLDTGLSGTQSNYAGTILESGEALLVIVNDLLDLSKMEAGKFVLDEALFNLEEAVESAAECLAWKAQEKGLEFVAYVQPSVPKNVIGDAGRLRQILLNLGSNAVKFTTQGSVTIFVELEAQSEDLVNIRFRVSDTGAGISEARRNFLFERYSQLHDKNTHRVGGTGLGLAICKQLVALMGGSIEVKSEEGVGSEFSFTAVLRKTQAADFPTVMLDVSVRCCSVITHELRQRALNDLLRSMKISHVPRSPVWDIDEFLSLESNAAGLDLLIWDSSGDIARDEEILSIIRGEWSSSNLPVLFLTPLAYRAPRQFEQYPDLAFVTKPVRKTMLSAAISRLIQSQICSDAQALSSDEHTMSGTL